MKNTARLFQTFAFTFVVLVLWLSLGAAAPLKPGSSTAKSNPSQKGAGAVKKTKVPEQVLNKSPKAIFLIKRAKVDADIGEPIIYPFQRQMKTLYYDVSPGGMRNE